jgi:hypothetical protein
MVTLSLLSASCENKTGEPAAKDPELAEKVMVDRFSDQAATLMRRSQDPSLPGPGEPINCDIAPFITTSLGPGGQQVKYYNFDVQSTTPAPIYVLFRKGEDSPVNGQLNIVDAIPGENGYCDFWKVYRVGVPEDYAANALTSYAEIISSGYSVTGTSALVNCPLVPEGSTAILRLDGADAGIHRGWCRDKIVYYFTFDEKALETTPAGTVPLSPIYVTFNINPDPLNPSSGPPSGFVSEPGTEQTHNVIATLPEDQDYSPLWLVYIYDKADFDKVSNLAEAEAAMLLAATSVNVNCPVVYIGE